MVWLCIISVLQKSQTYSLFEFYTSFFFGKFILVLLNGVQVSTPLPQYLIEKYLYYSYLKM